MPLLKKSDLIPFTQIPNEVLNSPALSFKAKGIYSYMMSKPDNWDFSTYRISLETKESKDSINAGIRELKDIGLLKYKKLSSGKIEYTIFINIAKPPTDGKSEPKAENPTKGIEPKADNPTMGKSHNGKTQPIINKETYKQRDLKNSQRDKIPSLKEHRALDGNYECDNSLETNLNGINNILDKLKHLKKVQNE